MSKKNHYNNNRDRSNYNQPDPDLTKLDELPSDEEVGEAELNVDTLTTQFIPNSLVYNAYGAAPTSATFRIMFNDLKAMFTKVCKSQIDGVDGVSATFDPTTGDVQFFCVFNENCRHFNDKSMEGTMCPNSRAIYYSPEVRAFAKKFGMNPNRDSLRDKNGKIIGEFRNFKGDSLNLNMLFVNNIDKSNNITRGLSMRLSWTVLVRLLFDIDGKAFEAQFNKKPSRCRLETHFEFSKQNDNVFGNILYLEVTKSTNSYSSGSLPRPKASFNYREA